MGKRGPTATRRATTTRRDPYSRWGNAGQPQLMAAVNDVAPLIADGETRANRNVRKHMRHSRILIADGETRANRNKCRQIGAMTAL